MRVTYQVLDASCAQCTVAVKKFLEKHNGVNDIKMNQMHNIFYIDYEPEKISEGEIEKTIKKIGYKTVKLRSIKEMQKH